MNLKKELVMLLLIGILLSSSCAQEKRAEKYDELEQQPKQIPENIPIEKNITTPITIEEAWDNIQAAERNESLETNDWWKPQPNTSWQWQLTGTLSLNYDVEMYDIDLFDTSKESIKTLHNKGINVVCYFSAGSYEDWRIDKDAFPKEVLGNTLEGWEDEKWLDISKIDLLAPIMRNRLDMAVEKECDGVEPDNVDGYLNDNGFSLTYQDQLTYNKWLAEEAHKRGLAIGLKNDIDQIPELVSYFDFAVNEQCFEYDECDTLLPFIEQNKAVFGVEYEREPETFCEEAITMKLSWLKMEYDLDGGRISC